MARVIEVPSPRLVIRAFGPGQVWINDKLVTISEWQTQSVRELFFYFLAARKPLTREQIGGILWPNTDEPGKFRMRFKNEIYRLRCAVGQDTIVFQHDYYQFNASLDHEYDIEAFESFLAKARSSSTAEEQIDFYQKAVDLAQGQYLEDLNGDWVQPERERLRQTFLTTSLTLAELYYKEGQSPRTIEICDRALAQDRTLEAAYRLLMQVYHRQGDRPSAIHAYRACEQNLRDVFGLPPSEETQQLYRDLTIGT
jgi:two-component SAPR family response regulator